MVTERPGTEYSTDTHLSKKYNDVVYDCMMRCNAMGFVNNGIPHYENLLNYYGAVNIFYLNTFILFEGINHNSPEPDGKFRSISYKLTEWSEEIEEDMYNMKTNPALRNTPTFLKTVNKCKNVHKLIMYGLQRRNMLVRMSEKEPTGSESINYWETKIGFRKGHIKNDEEMTHGR